MSHQRQAAAKSGAKRTSTSRAVRHQEPDHALRNMILIGIATVVVLSVVGFGAALIYDRTNGQTPSITAEEAQATAVGGDGARALMVRRYINEHYADTSWHESVMEYTGEGNKITLGTNLANDPFGLSRASKMCDAVSTFIYGEGRSEAKFVEISIVSLKGEPLVTRPDRNTVCSEVGT
jgi:hypothetical protein